ncbi:MAG: CpaF family protein [Planctomycetota bacterium]|mgnify:FL=1|nr:MAG: CpaF family protein [Planctomycetota bacterium]REJ97500.1 MAG: CpaF family protein [Planctomycetota bacterium]REK20948.1 MAG: CpaF family protein [Planctomycetota bacterium]REK37270.1 MAG: CpaF family protein [Planctomycetota bacterium]
MISTTPPQNDSRRKFQQLKTRLHKQMVDSIDMAKAGEIGEDEFRKQLGALANHLCERPEVGLPDADRSAMVRELMDEIYGFGPLQHLMEDPDVSDVLVNAADTVIIERNGKLEKTDVTFADDAHLLHFIQRLVGRAGRRIDEVSPMVDAKLADGSRLHAVIPPLALRGPTLSIRRFKTNIVQFEDMVKMGSLAPEMADFLIQTVRGRMNVLLSGGTGAGKTTMLNNLSRFIPHSERVVTIEETAELQLQQPDVVSLETRVPNVEGKGLVSIRDLLRNSLRMRPDRIIVGEARGGEVLDMLQAMNTGHDGSMSTVHANDTRDALQRLEMMIALSGAELPTQVMRQYIASAIQVFVHIARLTTGERKVMRISEVTGVKDGEYVVEDIFVYRLAGIADGKAQGAHYATGYEPFCLRRMSAIGFDVDSSLFEARELQSGMHYSPNQQDE